MKVKEQQRIAFLTLGCKVNQYETARLTDRFYKSGFDIVDYDSEADIYVVNTCTVTGIADRKSRKMLHRPKRINNEAIVVAMGCFAEAEREKLLSDSGIDIIIGNGEKEHAYDIIMDYIGQKDTKAYEKSECYSYESFVFNEHIRAYVKVQDGCNQFCTYCKIPYVRGKLKSRNISDICKEIEALADAGFMEVVLTGIHLSSFGVDKTDKTSFTELKGEPLCELIESVSRIPGIKRIRLGSLEPRIITDEFVKKISGVEKLCPHFHLSLQSGCDETLARMNRKYNTDEYYEAVRILRKYYDRPSVTTDVICGFPGETDEEFDESLNFVKKIRFSMIHVFKYSRRAGTKAYSMPNQVNEEVKNQRSSIMIDTAKKLTASYAESFIGSIQNCLVEETTKIDGKLYYIGHNERYMKLAFEAGGTPCDIINTIVRVIPEKYAGDEVLLCSTKVAIHGSTVLDKVSSCLHE